MKCCYMLLVLCLVLSAMLAISAGCQSANFGGISYEKVDPGFTFTQRPEPAQDWQMPNPTAAESKAGLLAYVTADPGDYLPDRRPKIGEHVGSLTTSLTPGEDRAMWFAVSALESAQGLEVKVDVKDAPVKVDIRNIHFWPQRTQWRGQQWYITPELLLPCGKGKRWVPAQRGVLRQEAFDVKSGQTAGFWLTFSAKSNAAAGKYFGTVTVKSKGKPALKLPLQIEVLPFKLKQPGSKRWLLYCDEARWQKMSDKQILNEMRDFKRHGFTGLVELSLGSIDITPLKTGGEPIVDASYYRRMTNLCKKAGIPGPHVITAGGIPERVAETLGITANLNEGDWPEQVKEGVKAVARAAMKATKNDPMWYFYGPDEPSGDNTYAVQTYECWGGAGAHTYATVVSGEFLNKSAKYITSPCFYAPMIGSESAWKKYYDMCTNAGVEFTWYGTGCYVNPFPQERYMYHNRYGAGFFFWKTKAVNAVAWTLCRPHEDVFNDFDGSAVNPAEPKDQAFVYPHLLKPDDWSTFQGDIPTIAWESHREGVNDYKYLYTLTSLIAEKQRKGSAAAKAAADDAQTKLDQIVKDIPFANLWGPVEFDPAKLQKGRQEVIGLILQLRSKK